MNDKRKGWLCRTPGLRLMQGTVIFLQRRQLI